MEPVMTTSGLVQGYELDGVHIWRGIPYASTPRFRKPEPYRWEGVFDATRGELDGYQQKAFLDEGKLFGDTFYYNEFKSPINYAYSDDFVTLNIVAPKDARDCPVIAFIHGGSFEVGNIAELPYGLTKEYAKRDVILVSIGYRLNVFALYRGGNYGLHDMAAAVDWLYDNIASFGGDPKHITLMGQSAGAMSITDLLYSHRLKGKVYAAITMSGGGMIPRGFSPWTKEQCQGFWDKVGRERMQDGRGDGETSVPASLGSLGPGKEAGEEPPGDHACDRWGDHPRSSPECFQGTGGAGCAHHGRCHIPGLHPCDPL